MDDDEEEGTFTPVLNNHAGESADIVDDSAVATVAPSSISVSNLASSVSETVDIRIQPNQCWSGRRSDCTHKDTCILRHTL